MDTDSGLQAIVQYFLNFDGAKALQVTYYSVALALASIGLWKTIRFAEAKMPRRLIEFAFREEGRIVEKQLRVLSRIKRVPILLQTNEYFDVNAEIDRAVTYLDKNNATKAASELHELAGRLEDKVKVAEAQLALTKHQAASVQLFFGALAQKVPERAGQSLTALKRAAELWPGDPEIHKEIGLLEKEVRAYQDAIKSFDAYWKAADELDPERRPDKKLLLIDAHELAAECHRALSGPDNERTELKGALQVAETVVDATMKPHAVRARLLEALGENARNRRTPQTDKVEEYLTKSAAEFTLAGLPADAKRVIQKKNARSAA